MQIDSLVKQFEEVVADARQRFDGTVAQQKQNLLKLGADAHQLLLAQQDRAPAQLKGPVSQLAARLDTFLKEWNKTAATEAKATTVAAASAAAAEELVAPPAQPDRPAKAKTVKVVKKKSSAAHKTVKVAAAQTTSAKVSKQPVARKRLEEDETK